MALVYSLVEPLGDEKTVGDFISSQICTFGHVVSVLRPRVSVSAFNFKLAVADRWKRTDTMPWLSILALNFKLVTGKISLRKTKGISTRNYTVSHTLTIGWYSYKDLHSTNL